MTPLEQQFEILRGYKPGSVLQKLPGGPYLVTVPGVELPTGWSKASVDVKFIAPVGYPGAQPDCFWTDPDLRLANGCTPQNTGSNPIPNVGTPQLWFSWHVQSWNANADNLLTYLNVIKRRLNDAR